jgi:hypothetical protein
MVFLAALIVGNQGGAKIRRIPNSGCIYGKGCKNM